MRKFLLYLDEIAQSNPFNNVYGLGRSFIAFSLLITFLFSSTDVLFDKYLFGIQSLDTIFDKINLFFLVGYGNLYIAKIIVVVICLLVISGFYPYITGILHWWVTFSFQQAGNITEGGDQIASILTLLLIPITLSDNRINHWGKSHKSSPERNFFALIPLYLLQLQMAILYLHSGVEKLYKVEEWKNGTALYYYLNDPLFGYPAWSKLFFDKLLVEPSFVSLFTWSVVLLEIILFGALFMKSSMRIKLFPFALLFHIFIAVIIGLYSFSLVMSGGLILYLLPLNQPLDFKRLLSWNQR
ncbi:sporulation-delaying protein SdpB family protein [Spirosoma endophyticum]|uniref:Antimicrobial peptide system protein, SdpB family n=1 Tax=Spirosoma endophyticum TaxID=662367 RepID=A0A1I1YBC6_9BACT|nr:sporulation-delaying protein SdpB family protein [Spirosoma endophyticum]SFE16925.1 antimicrobial peptide system protein, SdpB family [Spirosoma endophyticum]